MSSGQVAGVCPQRRARRAVRRALLISALLFLLGLALPWALGMNLGVG